jgi:L-asparaginase II
MLDKPLGDLERREWGDKPPTRISMNCSGKHAAMLLTCVTNGWPTEVT